MLQPKQNTKYGSMRPETLPISKEGVIGMKGPPGSSLSAAALLTKTKQFNNYKNQAKMFARNEGNAIIQRKTSLKYNSNIIGFHAKI